MSPLIIWIVCAVFSATVLALVVIAAWDVRRKGRECAELGAMLDARRERTRQELRRLEGARAAPNSKATAPEA